MQQAYVRDGVTGIYLWDYPVSFVRVPNTNEYIWLEAGVYLVQAVSHTWNDGGPINIIDIAQAVSQQGIEPSVFGDPS
ncbi:TPA: hypothetical protein I7283_08495 [Vibrio parahaemolyticus]|nr:hypothetical protein [Vibrio parahaemolyticus]